MGQCTLSQIIIGISVKVPKKDGADAAMNVWLCAVMYLVYWQLLLQHCRPFSAFNRRHCTLYKNKIIIIIICFKNSSAGDSNQGILYFKSCKISLYDLQDSKPNPYRGSFSAEPLIVPELSGRMKRRDKG